MKNQGMKQKVTGVRQLSVMMLLIAFIVIGTACGASSSDEKSSIRAQSSTVESHDELESGFPDEVPVMKGAKILDENEFNGNNYALLYEVDASFEEVLTFYVDAFDLDESIADGSNAYYEEIELESTVIHGLTIEASGDMINVYMVLEVPSSDSEDSYVASNVMTYDNAVEVELDSKYPSEDVPLFSPSKIIGCSIAPSGSGYVDLLISEDDFDNAVDFYENEMGLTKNDTSTNVQKAVSLKGKLGEFKVTILISQLMSGGNDPYVQIVVDK